MDFLDTVIGHPQNRNVDWVTIHPRTRSTPSTTPIRADALAILVEKYSPTLPILLSGDVFDVNSLPFKPSAAYAAEGSTTLTLNDILPRDIGEPSKRDGANDVPAPSNTGLSGFMSARGLLANPALFAGYTSCPWETVERFMCNVVRAPLPLKLAVHHVQEMCSPGMGSDKNALLPKKERAKFGELKDMLELIDFLDEKIEQHTGQKGLRRDL